MALFVVGVVGVVVVVAVVVVVVVVVVVRGGGTAAGTVGEPVVGGRAVALISEDAEPGSKDALACVAAEPMGVLIVFFRGACVFFGTCECVCAPWCPARVYKRRFTGAVYRHKPAHKERNAVKNME